MKRRYYTFSLVSALLLFCSCVFNGFVYAEEGWSDAVETSSVPAETTVSDGPEVVSDGPAAVSEAPASTAVVSDIPTATTTAQASCPDPTIVSKSAASTAEEAPAATNAGSEAPAAATVSDGPTTAAAATVSEAQAAATVSDGPTTAADTPGSNPIVACESATTTAEETPATTNTGSAPTETNEPMATPTETSEPMATPSETSEPAATPSETREPIIAPAVASDTAAAPAASSDVTAASAESAMAEPADASAQKSTADSGTVKIASAAEGTFSVVLSNQVYGYAGSSEDGNLSATFDLSFLSDELTSAPEGWTDPSGQGFYQSSFSLANMGRTTRGGIPSSCGVIIGTTPSSSNPGAAYGQSFTTSYIVNGQYLAAPPQMLNEDGNAPDLSEFSLMRFANQPGDRKYLYVINDSEDPLTLSIDVKNYSCSFLYPVDSGKGPETILRDIPKTITLQPGEYGYLSLTDNSDLPAGARLSDTQPSITPLDVNVLAGISSVGAFDDAHSIWSLPPGSALGDGAYALFRVEKRKTDTDNPKTDDSEDPNPGEENEKTPDDPVPPEETKETPDTPAPPAQTEKTPDNPAPPAQTEKAPDNPASPTDIQKQPEPTASTAPAPKKKQRKDKNTAQQNPVNEHTAVTRRTASSETPGDHADPVNTADHAPIEWYLTLMLAAGAAMLALSLFLRRRRDR